MRTFLLDRKGGNPNNMHISGFDHLTKIKQTNNLKDIWQKENPDKTLFTSHNKNQEIRSKIDRFYITKKSKNKEYINYSKWSLWPWCHSTYN